MSFYQLLMSTHGEDAHDDEDNLSHLSNADLVDHLYEQVVLNRLLNKTMETRHSLSEIAITIIHLPCPLVLSLVVEVVLVFLLPPDP